MTSITAVMTMNPVIVTVPAMFHPRRLTPDAAEDITDAIDIVFHGNVF